MTYTPSTAAGDNQQVSFSIASEELLKELLTLSPVLVSSPIVPILHNFLFRLHGDVLQIVASDLHTFIVSELKVQEVRGEVEIAVPAKMLLETVKHLPKQTISLSIHKSACTITLHTAQGNYYKLAGERAIDFPLLPVIHGGNSLQASPEALTKAIKNTVFLTSKQELTPALGGVHCTCDAEGTSFVATDGHRLVRYRRKDIHATGYGEFTIPSKPFQLLGQLLDSGTGEVSVNFHKEHIHFHLGRQQLISYLIQEPYPDHERVIPSNNPHRLSLQTADFWQSLKRMLIYANRVTHQVRFVIEETRLQIIAEDPDFANEAQESMSCVYSGEAMEVGFNVKLLLELVTSLTVSPRISFYLDEPSKAILLRPESEEATEERLLLIMPILLRKEAQ